MNEQLIIDIVYFLVHYVLQIFLMHFFYTLFLTPKDKKHTFMLLVLFPAINLILSYIGMEFMIDPFITFVTITILTIMPALICFKEPKRQCFFVAVLQYGLLILVDALYSSVVIATLGYFAVKLEVKTWLSIFTSLLYYVLFSIIIILTSFIWRKNMKKVQIKSMGLFMLFPLGQLLFLAACGSPTMTGDYQIFSNGFVVLAYIVSIISDIAMFYAMRESSKMEDMKIKMLEMEHSLEMQYQYYDSLMKKQEEIREYRHDINNLVATVEALVEKNISLSDGASMAEELKEKNQNLTVPLYCANPIVNTVLWQKQKEAESQGTQFDVNISHEESFPIDRIDICSLFANILDNALRETVEHENSVITINSTRKVGFLFISISNTSNKCISETMPITTKKGKNHGHGIEIIQKIVNKYEGEFIFNSENGIAKVMISLPIKE